MKTCFKCKNDLPLDAFCKDRQKKDGLRTYCRQCESKYNKTPERKARKNETLKIWWDKVKSDPKTAVHWERKLVYDEKWRKSPKGLESKEASWKRAYAKNKHLFNKLRVENVPKLNAKPGFFTIKEWTGLKSKFKNRCLSCLEQEPKIKITIDHIQPRSLGGPNCIENIQPLCNSCNASKQSNIINYIPIGGMYAIAA